MTCTAGPANQLLSNEDGTHNKDDSSTGLERKTSAPSRAGNSHALSDDLEPDVDKLPSKKARLNANAADAGTEMQPGGSDADTVQDTASNSAADDNPAANRMSNDAAVAAVGAAAPVQGSESGRPRDCAQDQTAEITHPRKKLKTRVDTTSANVSGVTAPGAENDNRPAEAAAAGQSARDITDPAGVNASANDDAAAPDAASAATAGPGSAAAAAASAASGGPACTKGTPEFEVAAEKVQTGLAAYNARVKQLVAARVSDKAPNPCASCSVPKTAELYACYDCPAYWVQDMRFISQSCDAGG